MKRIIICALLLSSASFAQERLWVKQSSEVIVACGGVFETMPPFADRATVGRIQSGNYTVFDTIDVEGVADVEVYSDQSGLNQFFEIYVAAQDSIIKYNDQYEREATIAFPAVKTVKAFDQYVVAGNWYGTSSAISVYDRSSMNLHFSIPTSTIPYTIRDIDIQSNGDSLYVLYNVPGTIDMCPPYGCYEDSLGRIAVIDIAGQAVERTINLAEDGAGARIVSFNSNTLFVSAQSSGNLLRYDISTSVLTTESTGILRSISKHANGDAIWNDGVAYNTGSGVMKHNFSSETATSFTLGFPVAVELDFTQDVLVHSETDYTTYGDVIFEDATGDMDTVSVNVSPDAMAIRYEVIGGSIQDNGIDVRIYPNPSNGTINVSGDIVEEYQVFSLEGELLVSGRFMSGALNLGLPAGIYMIKLISNEGFTTRRIVIQ